MQEKLSAQGAILVGDSPESFAAHIRSETKKGGDVVRAAGVKAGVN